MSDEIIIKIREGAYNSVYYWSKNRELAEDISQDFILKILEKEIKALFTNNSRAMAFGAVGGYRQYLDYKRKKRCPCLSMLNEIGDIEEDTNMDISEISDQELYDAIEKLPEKQKIYVYNVFLNKKTNKEYCEEFGENINAATARARYTRNKLKKLLTK